MNNSWKPESREGSWLAIDSSNDKAYLTFGVGSEMFLDVAELDLVNLSWRALPVYHDMYKSMAT